MHDTRYKGQQTPKARLQDVQYWLTVFDAIVCLTPEDIRPADTIDANDVIRNAVKAAEDRIIKEMESTKGADQ